MFLRHNHAERHAARQRNAPTPAAIQPRGMNVAFVIEMRLVHMREQRGVFSTTRSRRDFQQVRQQPQPAGGVHDQVWCFFKVATRFRKSCGAEFDAICSCHAHDFGGRFINGGTSFLRGFEQGRVKQITRDIVGITRQSAQLLEEEGEVCIVAQVERCSWFQHAELPHLILDAKLAEHGNDGRHERFADDERCGLGFMPDGNSHTGASQQSGKCARDRAAAKDGDGVDAAG